MNAMITKQSKCRIRDGVVPAANVIQAGERFKAHRPTTTVVTASVIRPDFGAAYWTPERLRRMFGLSVRRLPFVTTKGNNTSASAANFWNDAPTGNGRDDFKRGKKYAGLTIEAMTADGCASWYLEKIIQAIVDDVVSRRAAGGKYSRTLPPAVNGFIHELSRQLCERTTDIQPAS